MSQPEKFLRQVQESRDREQAVLTRLRCGCPREYQRGALIKLVSPDIGERGKYRITTLAQDGPLGHEVYGSLEEVARELRSATEVPQGTAQKLVGTEEFGRGLDYADEIRRGNASGRKSGL